MIFLIYCSLTEYPVKWIESKNFGGQVMTDRQIIISEKAPKALGPYSVANRIDDLVFTAGQLGIDPQTGELVPGGIEAETRQVLININNVLEAAGSSLDRVVKTTVFLRDMNDFSIMNSVYGQFFKSNFPARSTVQVAALPKGGAVEIETVALAK
jgi:2-iminobutanoate/2-iminopropanoate deaminase